MLKFTDRDTTSKPLILYINFNQISFKNKSIFPVWPILLFLVIDQDKVICMI